jgi:hypothetical protein
MPNIPIEVKEAKRIERVAPFVPGRQTLERERILVTPIQLLLLLKLRRRKKSRTPKKNPAKHLV